MKHLFICGSCGVFYYEYMITRRRWLSVVGVLLLSVAVGLPTPIEASTYLTTDQMRTARQNGDIKSLRWVLRQINPQYPGRMLDVALIQKQHQYIYKIKLLQPGGHLSVLWVDANNAEVLRVKGHYDKRKHDHKHGDKYSHKYQYKNNKRND